MGVVFWDGLVKIRVILGVGSTSERVYGVSQGYLGVRREVVL